MANLTPTPGWDSVFQLETDTPVLGGAGGVANSQAQALLNRTSFLEGATGSSKVGHTTSVSGTQTTVEAELHDHEQQLQNIEGNLNFTTLPDAILPVGDADLFLIRQGGDNKKLAASVLRVELATDANAAADRAEAARDAALLSKGLWPTTAAGIGSGVAGATITSGGSGGTDGTFDLAFSGGTQVLAPAGVFTVVGGVVVGVTLTYAGYYSAGTPTFSFAASAGLTGANITAVMAANTNVNEYFSVPVSGSNDSLILYRVDTGPVAAEVTRYPSSSSITTNPSANKVPKSEGSARPYIRSTWLAPEDSLPENAQTLISPEASIPEGWRDTGDTVGTRKVIARDLWRDIAARMSLGRVDFVGIGDSNQLFAGGGWDQGFPFALDTAGFPNFGTGLITINENAGSGGGQGYGYSALRLGATFTTTGAPVEVQKWFDKGTGNLGPNDPAYFASGTASATAQLGLNLNVNSWPGDITAELQYDLYTVSFASGAGQFRLFHRLNDNTDQFRGPTVLTNTGVEGDIVKTSLVRSARTPTPGTAVQFMANQLGYVNAAATPIIGPFFSTYQRVTVPSQLTGWSYSTLYGVGGQSLRDMADALQQASDETLTHYFEILRSDQDQDTKAIALCVHSGLNDRNETLPSLGPGAIVDGDSADAFVDNFKAIRNRIEEIWALNTWPVSELYWLCFVSHPVDDPDDTELVSYRTAIADYFALEMPRGEIVDLSALTTESELLAEGWYASGGTDRNHLTNAGYESLATRILSEARILD